MTIAYHKIKLPCGIICNFKCSTIAERMRLAQELKRTNYELLKIVTVHH